MRLVPRLEKHTHGSRVMLQHVSFLSRSFARTDTARVTNPTERMRLFRKELKIKRCVIYLRIGISIGRFGRVLPLSEFGLRCMRWNGAARIWDVATA